MRVILLLLFALPATCFAKCDQLQALSWLLGQWQSKDSHIRITESWQKLSTHTYEGSGASYLLSNNKQQSEESFRLVQMKDEVYYIVSADHNPDPMWFRLVSCDHHQAKFENKSRKFPQSLLYTLTSPTTLAVTLSGDGKPIELAFAQIPHQH